MDFKTWLETVQDVIYGPSEFFEKMPKKGGFEEPLTFFIATVFAAALATITLVCISQGYELGFFAIGIAIAILSLVTAWMAPHMTSIPTHAFLKLFGAKNDYEATFRATCYAAPIYLLYAIVCIAPLSVIVILPYNYYLLSVAYSKAQDISIFHAIEALLLLVFAGIAITFGIVNLIA